MKLISFIILLSLRGIATEAQIPQVSGKFVVEGSVDNRSVMQLLRSRQIAYSELMDMFLVISEDSLNVSPIISEARCPKKVSALRRYDGYVQLAGNSFAPDQQSLRFSKVNYLEEIDSKEHGDLSLFELPTKEGITCGIALGLSDKELFVKWLTPEELSKVRMSKTVP